MKPIFRSSLVILWCLTSVGCHLGPSSDLQRAILANAPPAPEIELQVIGGKDDESDTYSNERSIEDIRVVVAAKEPAGSPEDRPDDRPSESVDSAGNPAISGVELWLLGWQPLPALLKELIPPGASEEQVRAVMTEQGFKLTEERWDDRGNGFMLWEARCSVAERAKLATWLKTKSFSVFFHSYRGRVYLTEVYTNKGNLLDWLRFD